MSSDTSGVVGLQTLTSATGIASSASQRHASEVPSQPAAQPQATPAPVPSAEAVKASAQQIESYLKSSGRQLEFRLDDRSGQLVVSVRDATTGDLIRQIPGDAVLRIARALKENPVSLISLTA
jgi:flagellar protein FlaG